jgi:hypothetical protein
VLTDVKLSMTIQKEFIVRYRSTGHVRFQVPARVCAEPVATLMTAAFASLAGVYRVQLFKQHGKLSIRFDETVCSFQHLATQVAAALATLEQQGHLPGKASLKPESGAELLLQVGHKVKNSKLSRWVKGKVSDAQETVQAAKIITKLGMKRPKGFINDPEKTFITFLNDIVVLYLLKTHWKQVIQLWIPNPLKYRYEWLTVFYLFYLLLRSRKASQ